MSITVLGPTQSRLERLIDEWDINVQESIVSGHLDPEEDLDGLESFGRDKTEPVILDKAILKSYADNAEDEMDDEPPNGSSICVLLEHNNKLALMTGDAFSPDVEAAVEALSPDEPLSLDLFKVPHHGSLKNLSASLVKSISCKR